MTSKENELRVTRWQATFTVEYDVTGYPIGEALTAEHNADRAKRALQRMDRDINCSRASVKLEVVERVG